MSQRTARQTSCRTHHPGAVASSIPLALTVALATIGEDAGSQWSGFRGPTTDGVVDADDLHPAASLGIASKRDLGPGYSGVLLHALFPLAAPE